MKKLTFFWYGCLVLMLVSSCSKDSTLLEVPRTNDSDESFSEEEIIPIDINAKVREGALVFESTNDFLKAREVLSNVNLASRLAWEKSIGFESIRSVYEKAIIEYMEQDDQSSLEVQNPLLDYSEGFPLVRDYNILISSVLSTKEIFYIKDAVGSIGKKGSFWVMDGDVEKLYAAINNPQAVSSAENGVLIFRNGQKNDLDEIEVRSCTSTAEDNYSDFQDINNGTGRGSTRITSLFEFDSGFTPAEIGQVDYFADAYIHGRSWRRKSCRCGWNTHKDDHMFFWNIEIGDRTSGFPITYTTYSGQETHNNNSNAIKNIFSVQRKETIFLINQRFFFLNKVEFDTRHTTANLNLTGAAFSCN